MKTMKTVLMSIILMSLTPAMAASAADYEFVADSSVQKGGSCYESVTMAMLFGQRLVIAGHQNINLLIQLSPSRAEALKKLGTRQWGEYVKVVISDGPKTYVFEGDSCGRALCDSLSIFENGQQVEKLEQPIHGLTSIGCQNGR